MEEEKFSEYDSESCEISYFALCYLGGIEFRYLRITGYVKSNSSLYNNKNSIFII